MHFQFVAFSFFEPHACLPIILQMIFIHPAIEDDVWSNFLASIAYVK